MARYRLTPHNYQQFSASFYDTNCLNCNSEIEEGDPIAFILEDPSQHQGRRYIPNNNRFGPVCTDCLKLLGTPLEIEKLPPVRSKPS